MTALGFRDAGGRACEAQLSPVDAPEIEADWSDLELVCEALSEATAGPLNYRGDRSFRNQRGEYVKVPAITGGAALLIALRDEDFATFGQLMRQAVEAALIAAQERKS